MKSAYKIKIQPSSDAAPGACFYRVVVAEDMAAAMVAARQYTAATGAFQVIITLVAPVDA